ncbi:MAG: hypothetical protein ACLQNE_33585, partial [Thermoguttaceae bacterium]
MNDLFEDRRMYGPFQKNCIAERRLSLLSAAKNLPNLPRSFASLRMTWQNSRVAELLKRAIFPSDARGA